MKVGDRVERITCQHCLGVTPGMQGVVTGMDGYFVVVQWDGVAKSTHNDPSYLKVIIPEPVLTPTGALLSDLKAAHPHGHPDFIPDCMDIIDLHSRKNHDYAAGGDPLGNFDRVSAILKLYPGFPASSRVGVTMIYMLKQFDCVMWGLATGIKKAVEGLEDRFRDIAVYTLLARIMWRHEQK